MIDNLLANKLIEKISQFTEYNVNIMDENGVINASSRMKERIGTFHEVAFQIIKGDEDTIIVNQESKGVLIGVNTAICVNKVKVGVVGVTGNPQIVMPMVKIIRVSVEMMLEYEMFKYESIKKYNLCEQMLHLIFYSDKIKREDMERYTNLLQLNEHLIRVPILIEVQNPSQNMEQIMDAIRGSVDFTKQDLIGVTREGFVFLLKSIDSSIKNLMKDYKYIIGEFMSPFLRHAKSNNLTCCVYVGPLQDDIMHYRQAYLYCDWMQKNIGKEGSFYFYDYIVRYLESMVSMTEFHAVFFMLIKELGQKFIDNFMETVRVLIDTDYNLIKASTIMHVHKNTLVYRLDKIRETLNMNPLVHNTDREFIDCFYFYLKSKQSSKIAEWTKAPHYLKISG